MSLKYGSLILLAFLIILLLIFKNYETWTLPVETFSGKVVTKKPGTKKESPPVTEERRETASVQSYLLVAEKNIFSPERKEFPIIPVPGKDGAMVGGVIKKPIVRPQIILYGVTILGDYQAASLSSPGRPLKRGERDLMTLKLGESVGEYKLTLITPDRITMEAPEDRFDVMLYTPKQRTYAKTETKPVSVTSTLPAPAGEAPAPQQPVQGKVAEAPMPRPVTPAPVPSPRTRRFFGPAPAGESAPGQPGQ